MNNIHCTTSTAKRLKMVRVGRPEMMNHKVKDISLKELAKRDVKRLTNHSSNMKSSDSIEHEVRPPLSRKTHNFRSHFFCI